MRVRGFEPVNIPHKKHRGEPMPPSLADVGSAGYDFFSPANYVIQPKGMVTIWTDVRAYMLIDEWLMVASRSGQGKVRVTLANSIGVIDHSYHDNPTTGGNIGIMLVNDGDEPFIIEYGQAIAQGIFMKKLLADNTFVRRQFRFGGFGSSDVNLETVGKGDWTK